MDEPIKDNIPEQRADDAMTLKQIATEMGVLIGKQMYQQFKESNADQKTSFLDQDDDHSNSPGHP